MAGWTGSDWSIEIVDNEGDVGAYTSLAIDSNDNPHVSYYDNSNSALKYAYWAGSRWLITTIDSVGDVGSYTSLALDGGDGSHISYHDGNNFDLRYARSLAPSYYLPLVLSAAP